MLANAIEMPRMLDEVLAGLEFQPIEYPWTADQNPAFAVDQARTALGATVTLGADWPLPNTVPFEPALARTRATLDGGRGARYRALGRDTGRIVGDVCRRLTPGDDEREIAATMADALAAVQARGVVAAGGIGRTHPSISSSRADRHALETCRACCDVRRTGWPDR